MSEIIQHIPTYVDGALAQRESFMTLDGLLAVPFVALWKERVGFYRFSRSSRFAMGPTFLMAELNEGRDWYVVGHLEETGRPVDLPVWQPVHGPVKGGYA